MRASKDKPMNAAGKIMVRDAPRTSREMASLRNEYCGQMEDHRAKQWCRKKMKIDETLTGRRTRRVQLRGRLERVTRIRREEESATEV